MAQQIFYFDEIFAAFGVGFDVIHYSEGYRDMNKGGQWVKGTASEPQPLEGVITNMTRDDLRFEEQGYYTEKDRKLYLRHPDRLSKSDEVIFQDETYRVVDIKDHGVYADFSVYFIKRADKGSDAS